MRRITFTTILILAGALIAACGSSTPPANDTNAQESPAASQTPEPGETNAAVEPTATDNSQPENSNSDAAENVAKAPSNESAKKPADPCKAARYPSKRISFPKGATETTFTWTMNGFDDEQVVLINTRAGQELRIEDVGSNPVTLSVCDPDGQNVDDYDLSCHGRFKLDKTKKGDYTVFVTECKKADPWKGSYKLKVTAVDAS